MVPTIILDLDGTVALGDGPIRAYARAIDEVACPGFEELGLAALREYVEGRAEHRDGYHAIAAAAQAAGVADDGLQRAYTLSRERFGTPAAPVSAPSGLADFLATLQGRATVVLATNSPPVGIEEALREWGALPHFGALHYSVGKPAGLVPIVRAARAQGPVLSVGDIPEFDLHPAAMHGADTALVGPSSQTSGFEATMRGHTLTDLYDDISAWVRASRASSAE
ncbi:HAD family hydrolase [Microbacterium sediminicola]|uniref:HAD family hydrolase n=1 Tax=Microbacterium sediminicola TaxID=415210 RepID=A0ABP4U2I4_9MICO